MNLQEVRPLIQSFRQLCHLNKYNKDNRGLTLIELSVSLLVSSFVVLAASFFLSMGVRTYNATSREVSLQMESQIALNLIENLIIEADTCEYDEAFAYTASDTCTLFRIYRRENASTTGLIKASIYLVILDSNNSKLLLKTWSKETGSTEELEEDIRKIFDVSEIQTAVAAALSAARPSLLASYVTKLEVTPGYMNKDTEDLVRVYVKLEIQDRMYESTSNVSMRNGVHR